MPTTTERIITEIPATITHAERDIRNRILRMAAYCRVSTDSEDQLNSYNSQIDYYTTIINENPKWKSLYDCIYALYYTVCPIYCNPPLCTTHCNHLLR